MHLELLGTAKFRANEALRAKPDRNMSILLQSRRYQQLHRKFLVQYGEQLADETRETTRIIGIAVEELFEFILIYCLNAR